MRRRWQAEVTPERRAASGFNYHGIYILSPPALFDARAFKFLD
jgi:hypothetical protein